MYVCIYICIHKDMPGARNGGVERFELCAQLLPEYLYIENIYIYLYINIYIYVYTYMCVCI